MAVFSTLIHRFAASPVGLAPFILSPLDLELTLNYRLLLCF